MPTIYGEDAVLRVLDKESIEREVSKLSLDVVGFPEYDLVKFRRYIKEPYGMVLGRSDGRARPHALRGAERDQERRGQDHHHRRPGGVPGEGITQIPVNEKKGLTFARGLRSILRHDPDKVMVGEIRDQETAQIAINAALTGHLVFTTVHANNVFDVLAAF